MCCEGQTCRSGPLTKQGKECTYNSLIYKAFSHYFPVKQNRKQKIQDARNQFDFRNSTEGHLRPCWASTTDSLLLSPRKRGLLCLWISQGDIFSMALKRRAVWSPPVFYVLNNFDKDGKRIKCISVMPPFSTFVWLKKWQGIGPHAVVTLCQHQSQQTALSRLIISVNYLIFTELFHIWVMLNAECLYLNFLLLKSQMNHETKELFLRIFY